MRGSDGDDDDASAVEAWQRGTGRHTRISWYRECGHKDDAAEDAGDTFWESHFHVGDLGDEIVTCEAARVVCAECTEDLQDRSSGESDAKVEWPCAFARQLRGEAVAR